MKGDDKKIPDTAPFPGGDEVPPFLNADDRIFEANVAGWGWDGGAREQHGLPEPYVRHLEQVQSEPDPNANRAARNERLISGL